MSTFFVPGFLSGAVMMSYVVVGLFFARYWTRTRDRFFGMFALAFWLMAIERVLIAATNAQIEELPKFYVIRLVAFLTIMIAIWDKNRPKVGDDDMVGEPAP